MHYLNFKTFALVFLLVFSFTLSAQSNGTINGKVTGPDGRPLPNASVSVTGQAGNTQTAVTRNDGSFSVSNLTPGTYRVQVQLTGFMALTQPDVTVSTGSPIVLALALQPGSSNQRVQVQADAFQIQDRNAAITVLTHLNR